LTVVRGLTGKNGGAWSAGLGADDSSDEAGWSAAGTAFFGTDPLKDAQPMLNECIGLESPIQVKIPL
jgi:hypothetical protein